MQLLYKVAVIARFLNLTERRVQQLARDGIIPKPEKGKKQQKKLNLNYP